MRMRLTGANLVGGRERTDGSAVIESVNPRTGVVTEPRTRAATDEEVTAACVEAEGAAKAFAGMTPTVRARMLRVLADALDAEAQQILSLAEQETALGVQPRLEGELARTTGQLRFIAEVLEDGGWLEATIDHQPDGPSIRRMLLPLGPVAVFSASNFPLAFSVAGGDTAAAMAAGCPVVVKAHPSHPLTSELVGRIVTNTLRELDVPEGAFALVHGLESGKQLVMDERVRAVAFTGSFQGGMALAELANARNIPIPVYAEMGSLNPVVVTPEAAQAHAQEIAQGFVGSMTLGTGQFCTKPGLLFVPADVPQLEVAITDLLRDVEPAPMLNLRIASGWRAIIERWQQLPEVEVLVPPAEADAGPAWLRPALLAASASGLTEDETLHEECFGPAAILVRYQHRDDLRTAVQKLPGSLAAAIHGSTEDALAADLLEDLTRIAGRVVWNGWPTGVAVVWAMNHGGPFPATTNPLHTSVGATSLRRFLRPVTYQDVPEALLPAPLQDKNPWAVPQRVDGKLRVPH